MRRTGARGEGTARAWHARGDSVHWSPAAEVLVHVAVALTAGADDGAAGDVDGREEAAAVLGTVSRPEILKDEVLEPHP